ncbi:MAG: hypothetical protein AAF960_27460, partial [Bacteroidota bacterium]
FLSDIWRGSVESIAGGEWEAAPAQSINKLQQLGVGFFAPPVRGCNHFTHKKFQNKHYQF